MQSYRYTKISGDVFISKTAKMCLEISLNWVVECIHLYIYILKYTSLNIFLYFIYTFWFSFYHYLNECFTLVKIYLYIYLSFNKIVKLFIRTTCMYLKYWLIVDIKVIFTNFNSTNINLVDMNSTWKY